MLRPRWKNLPWIYCSMLFHLSFWSINYPPRQVLQNPSLIYFSAFKVGVIPHHGDVVCYISRASNSFASYRQPSWNESQTYSLNDRFALTSREQVTGCVGVLWIFKFKTFGNSHGVIYTCLWNAAAAYFQMKAHHFYSFFFFFSKSSSKRISHNSIGFKSAIKHSFYGPLWWEFVFDCTLTTKLS